MRLPTSGVSSHLEEHGAPDGCPVLFLHGNPDSAELWRPVIGRLDGSRYRFLAPDLPGFGRSATDASFDQRLSRKPLETMARWVEEVLAEARVAGSLHLVAHDFGGPYGFAWAVRNPRRVLSLTGVDTLFFPTYRWHFWARVWRTPLLGELSMWLFGWWLFRFEMRRGSPSLTDESLRETWRWVRPAMKRMVLRLYRATDPKVFRGRDVELEALMARRPSLALWGADDPYIPARWAESLGARRVEIREGCGHWPPLEAPGWMAEQLERLFLEVESTRTPPEERA